MTRTLLNTEQAALELDIPVWLLHTWQALNDGPLVVRVGTTTLYRRTDLERWKTAGRPLLTLSSRIACRAGRDDIPASGVSDKQQTRIASGM